VSDTSAGRALHLLGELVEEAARRGARVSLADNEEGAIWVAVRGYESKLLISEQYEPTERSPSAAELGQRKLYAWQRVQPVVVPAPSGRLTFELPLDYAFPGRRRRWADGERQRLEGKLTAVLAELEARAEIVAQRRGAEERARADRRRQWEQAMTAAQQRFREERRQRALLDQVGAWAEARDILAFCDALDALALGQPDANDAAELGSWSKRARSHATARDPLANRPLAPAEHEPGPEELRPFLGHWSPYGPDEPPSRKL